MTLSADQLAIILTVMGAILYYVVRTERRLTRIETKIDLLMECTPACRQPSDSPTK